VAQIPHFAFPFKFTPAGPAAEVEQDSPQDVASCVAAVLSYPAGSRADVPTFGVPDQSFRANGANVQEIREALNEWEPRASAELDLDDDLLAQGVVSVQVFLGKARR
jgi:phage baseplate assembly protein W